VVKGSEVLPNRFGDTIVTQAEEELLSENAGESEGDITEKDVSGFPEGALAELDVREQGIDGVKGLSVRATGPLGRSEEVVSVHLIAQGVQDSFFPKHTHDINQSEATVVDGMEWV
jgi:hypothetical protein